MNILMMTNTFLPHVGGVEKPISVVPTGVDTELFVHGNGALF